MPGPLIVIPLIGATAIGVFGAAGWAVGKLSDSFEDVSDSTINLTAVAMAAGAVYISYQVLKRKGLA